MKKDVFIVALIFIILIGIMLISQTLKASDPVYLETRSSSQGGLMRIVNQTTANLYCHVTYNKGYSYFDFYVNANSYSRWYFEPQGYYEWRCQ